MKDKDIAVLLRKADELKALFILGQRVIPFLEEIFVFVSDIKPLLDEINISIKENLKKMPNASRQLSKVTEATERSTTEIMDIVDGIVYKSEIIASNLKNITEIDAKRRNSPIKLLEIIYKAIQQDSNLAEILPQLSAIIENMKSVKSEEYDKTISDTLEMLQSISFDSSSIMMSLQVQDITSQQIAAVNNLLETIQKKLGSIMDHFQNDEMSELVKQHEESELLRDKVNTSRLHREIAFDPDAVESISKKEHRQKQVDKYIDEHNEEDAGMEEEAASQDDIDALFSGVGIIPGEPEAEEPKPARAPTAPAPSMPAAADEEEIMPEDELEQFSQDDIDAMFGL